MNRKFKMFIMNHWIKIIILVFLAGIIIFPIVMLSTLDSYQRLSLLASASIWIPLGIINAGVFVYLLYVLHYGGGFAKLRTKKIKGQSVNVHWDDVIGIDEAKEESMEVVQLITDRRRLQKIGGKILRGLLMIGPPGCGKTYLAKAIATEAGIPFISMAASEFTEIFVGVGASRVRKLFKKARRLAYGYGGCIVFIDELEAIGRQRSFSFFGGGQETNSTQNQLLVEMDGLQSRAENVIVIGATNALESVLDEALLRPGRFDRKVYIDPPGLEGREKLFKHYLKTVKCEDNLDIGRLARKTVYKTPADVENAVKEAALIATRQSKDTVGFKELSEAIERMDMGMKRKRSMAPKEREMVAYHEAGHLIVMYILHPTEDVFKASIISRRESLGAVYSQPREELFTHSKDKLLADIKVSLGGYVAEKLWCGVTSTGVSSDFDSAMKMAHFMVWKYGMGKNGLVGDYTIIPEHQLSEKIKEKLNNETSAIFRECIREVEDLLVKERGILDRFAGELLEKEELEYDEIVKVFSEYGKDREAQVPMLGEVANVARASTKKKNSKRNK